MQHEDDKSPHVDLGRGGRSERVRRRLEEQLRYLEGEADYLEITDPQRYQDMIIKRRREARRIRRLIEKCPNNAQIVEKN